MQLLKDIFLAIFVNFEIISFVKFTKLHQFSNSHFYVHFCEIILSHLLYCSACRTPQLSITKIFLYQKCLQYLYIYKKYCNFAG